MYTGPNQTPDDPVSIAALVALPTVHSITGMVKIHFTSDHTVALSGFALRFFALHKYRGKTCTVKCDKYEGILF